MQFTLAAVVVVTAIAIGLVVLNPRLLKAPVWRATVTPLASIVGSGFLVAGPILAHTVGNWAWLGMAGLCLAAYLFGAVIRHNIRTVEPMLKGDAPPAILLLERLSHFALAFAYFISVAYYLNLFAAFVLRGGGVVDPGIVRIVAAATILAVGGYGTLRGLGGMELIEELAVGVKLSAIGGLIASMAVLVGTLVWSGAFALHPYDHPGGAGETRVLLGLLILVQGFETSRFLGAKYDAALRIRTMRYAQWSSSAIYVVFVLLMTPLFGGSLPAQGGETAIIDVLAPLGMIAAPAVIVAAVCSQLSAAVADMNGAGGLLHVATAQRVPLRIGYALTTVAAVAITWSANIYEIIAYASKAFVLYYGLQSVLAVVVVLRAKDERRPLAVAGFALAAALAAAIIAFGMPVEA